MNLFEKYLKDHEDLLRKEAEASSELWGRIESRLIQRRQNRIRVLSGMAATIALLLASAAFLKVHFENKNIGTSVLPLYTYSKEYGNAEKEYIEAVEYNVELLNETYIPVNQKPKLESFLTGIKALDKAYEGYCEIIEEEGCDEIMMELIIDNYKRKLELLECLQEELIKINYYEKDNESTQTTLSL